MNKEEKKTIEYIKSRLYGNEGCDYIDVAQEVLKSFVPGIVNENIEKDFIPIQKIKDKIEKEIKYHEKNILEIENITMLKSKTAKEEAEIEFNKYAIVVLKRMLQELIEGEN